MNTSTTLISGACDTVSGQSYAGSNEGMSPWRASEFDTRSLAGNRVSHLDSKVLLYKYKCNNKMIRDHMTGREVHTILSHEPDLVNFLDFWTNSGELLGLEIRTMTNVTYSRSSDHGW